MSVTLSVSPFSFSLDSMEESTRQEARRAPTTFLYATLSRLRSCTGEAEARVINPAIFLLTCRMRSMTPTHLHGKLNVQLRQRLHADNHVVVALRLLGELGLRE